MKNAMQLPIVPNLNPFHAAAPTDGPPSISKGAYAFL
jgi:hypothetical protein